MAATGIGFAKTSVLSRTPLKKKRSESKNGFFDIFLKQTPDDRDIMLQSTIGSPIYDNNEDRCMAL